MLIYGHKGASGTSPENTLLALKQALADGVDGVEFDVRATADGVPVLLHDRGLERTTDGRGNVDELSLAEVRSVDAGQGATVPTLEEAVALLAGRTRLDVELKQAGKEREVLAILAAVPRDSWAISSFDREVLRALRALDPRASLWPLAPVVDDALIAVATEVAAPTVALRADAVTAEAVGRFAEAGRGVMAWTVNNVDEARRLRALGTAVLCTDLPAAMRRGLDTPEAPSNAR